MPGTLGGYTETLTGAIWINQRLTGDATLMAMLGEAPQRVWHPMAAEGAVVPYVVFTDAAPHDVLGVGGGRIMTDMLYTVRGVAESSDLDSLKGVARRIDFLLHNASGPADDGTVLWCVRMNPVSTPELRAGRQWSGLGGVYKLWVQ